MAASRMVRSGWRLGGSLVTVGMLVVGVTQVVLAVAREEYTVERTFDAAGIATIDVRSSSGSVTVVGTDAGSDTIAVTAHVSDGLRRTDHEEYVEGDRLLLETTCPFLSDFCEVEYVIEAPAGVDVGVRAQYGDITASYLQGDMEMESGHGRIEVVGIEGDVRLHSGYGSVSATGVAASVVDASSSHGDVSVELADAPRTVEATSAYGDVDVVVPEDGSVYDVVRSGTDMGVLATPISTDPSSERSITATSGQGDVTIRYGS